MILNEAFKSNILRNLLTNVKAEADEFVNDLEQSVDNVTEVLKRNFWAEPANQEEVQSNLEEFMKAFKNIKEGKGSQRFLAKHIGSYEFQRFFNPSSRWSHLENPYCSDVEKDRTGSTSYGDYTKIDLLRSCENEMVKDFLNKKHVKGRSEKSEWKNYEDDEENGYYFGDGSNKQYNGNHGIENYSSEWNDSRFIQDAIGNIVKLSELEDDDFELVKKAPKSIREDGGTFSHTILFWIISDNPKTKEILPGDELYAITSGNWIKWFKYRSDVADELRGPKGRQSRDIKIGDIYNSCPESKLKVLAVKNPYNEEQENLRLTNKYLLQDRREAKTGVISNISFIRDEQYKNMIKKNVERYKKIIEDNRLTKDDTDKYVAHVIDQIHELMKAPENMVSTYAEFKTSQLRMLSGKLSQLIDNYEKYLRNKESLGKNNYYSEYYSNDHKVLKSNIKAIETEIAQMYKKIIGGN